MAVSRTLDVLDIMGAGSSVPLDLENKWASMPEEKKVLIEKYYADLRSQGLSDEECLSKIELTPPTAALPENHLLLRRSSDRSVLKELDCFVLDNSLRESTVGQIRGHTIADKLKIFDEVKRCGFKNLIVASFSNLPRVEDAFMEELVKRGQSMSGMYAFTELSETLVSANSLPDAEKIPIGLLKMKKYGIPNIIIEIDLADSSVPWNDGFRKGISRLD